MAAMFKIAALFLVCLCFSNEASGATLFDFYDFGPEAGDDELPLKDEVSTNEILLGAPITFFDKTYFAIFVNDNGLLSFLTEIPYFHNAQFPLDYPMIAPFYSDVDLSSAGGHVWYRQTSSPALLDRAKQDLKAHFSLLENYNPKSLVVATWESVGPYKQKTNKRNTFQVVLVTDSVNSFAIFHYADGGLDWLQGDGKTSGLSDAIAQAGFNSDNGKLYTLRGSGTDQVRNLDKWTNVDKPGVWMFKIGKLAPGQNIQPPDLVNGEIIETGYEHEQRGFYDSCATGGLACHSLADCTDFETGFCCQCKPKYSGNGIVCISNEAPIRVTGKVSGNINGMEFADADLHSYVLATEGRTYTAVSRISKDIGYDLQSLTSIGEGIAWLFALPKDGVKNGFEITGGILNRNVEITFPQTGHKAFVRQNFKGLDVFNNIVVMTNVSGSVPTVPYRSEIVVDSFNEEITRVERGKLRSRSNRSFKLKEQYLATPFNVETIMDFEECPHEPILPEHDTLRLKVDDNIFIRYDQPESILRYSFSTHIGTLEEEDPCILGREECGINSDCIVDGDSYRCVCKQGYEHVFDPLTAAAVCLDMNECDLGRDVCDQNAQCINNDGSYSCQCNTGFSGTGFYCDSLHTCENAGCDVNADCKMVNDRPVCTCRLGYTGSGFYCDEEIQQDNCFIRNDCSVYATCRVLGIDEYVCVCEEGYIGDGYNCSPIESDILDLPNLIDHENNYHTKPKPECSNGNCWCPGDYYYRPESQTCEIRRAPDIEFGLDRPLPQCDDQSLQCVCPNGFTYNADYKECDLNDVFPVVLPYCGQQCECPQGYVLQNSVCSQYGTELEVISQPICYTTCNCPQGYQYIHENSSCSIFTQSITNVGEHHCDQMDICHTHAECVFDDLLLSSVCVCKRGYEGDGIICTIKDECNSVQDCDENAQCTYDGTQQKYKCVCISGYEGTGFQCSLALDKCRTDRDCYLNARCVLDAVEQRYKCHCNPGYEKEGLHCKPTSVARDECNGDQDCDMNAECLLDNVYLIHKCICKVGYNGNGFSCSPTAVNPGECNGDQDCDRNAQCLFDNVEQRHLCICNLGYEKNGAYCTAVTDECRVPEDCDANAKCIYVQSEEKYKCSCESGYEGNGLYCEPTEALAGCDVLQNCNENAVCIYVPSAYIHRCQCKDGYEGDGYYCKEVTVDCNLLNNCGENGECIFDYNHGIYECRCSVGFKGDGYTCRSIQSCIDDLSVCHTYATCQLDSSNQDYICVCQEGYTGDGIFCQEIPEHEKNLLIINQGLSILRLPTDDGPGQPIHVDAYMTAVGADVDCKEGLFYWTDVGNNAIRSSKYDGADKKPLISGELAGSPEDVAVDWISKNIYWTDSKNDVVSVTNYAGDMIKTVITGDLVNPRGIAVHPGLGLLFWSDWNRDDPKIETSGMDGSERRNLVSGDGISLPNSLVVDYETGMVCWADAGTHRIECVGITGYSRRVIMEEADYPFGLTIHYRSFYYTDWKDLKIHQVNKYTGEKERSRHPPLGGSGKLYGIVAVPESCPPVYNVCQENRGNCPSNRLCLPNGQGGRLCVCPDNSRDAECLQQ